MTRKSLSPVSLLPRALTALLMLAAIFWATRPAESVAPLGYSWSCASQSCSFYVTTTNHGAYQWNFGDGTITGISTSTSAFHVYGTPNDGQFHHADVALAGYATVNSGSPDNIISCTITYAASSVGIGTSGSCS